jgi:hypothetical protein
MPERMQYSESSRLAAFVRSGAAFNSNEVLASIGETRPSHHQPKLDFKGIDPASRNSLVSTS